MAKIPYRDFEIDVRSAGYLGFNAYISSPLGVQIETLNDRIGLHALEASKAFIDKFIEENPVAQLEAAGDTNGQDIDESPHTVWTYAATQAVYEPLTAVTELFIFAAAAGPTGTLVVEGTKAPGAAIAHECLTVERTLNGTTPVSLSAAPGTPTAEDLFNIRDLGPKTPADVVPGGVEIFITGPGSSGGVPSGNVYGHLAVGDGVTRNQSQMGIATVPAGFEAAVAGFILGSHEDSDVWLEIIKPGSFVVQSIRLPLKSAHERFFPTPRVLGPVENPSRFPPGTFFRLMGAAKKAGGVNQTRLGGDISIPLFKVST